LDTNGGIASDGKVLVHLIKQDWNDSDGCLTCPMLKDNKCSIYDKRALICRLYGVVENMKSRFGCKATRYLTNKEGVTLVSAVKKLEIDEYFSYDRKSVNGYRQ
jgi:Fe-S-cluster containining protein